jgi:hypothetical protein
MGADYKADIEAKGGVKPWPLKTQPRPGSAFHFF